MTAPGPDPTIAPRGAGQEPDPGPGILDAAHIGEIRGALGTIRMEDYEPRRTWRQRLLTLAAIMGPGLIVMVGDNDAGGVSTYAQAGQSYGYTLLWTLLLLVPVLIINQEMAMRLGVVTGVGHVRLVRERFGQAWGILAASDLFVLNFLTIVTEFIGVRLGAAYLGLSAYVAVPLAAILLVLITASGNFRRWERAMFLFLVTNLLIVPLAVIARPDVGASAFHLFVPGIRGGLSSDAVLLVIAVVGTTVTPWQLVFQQSNVADKRITPRWMAYERADTVIGAFVVIVGAAAIMMATAAAFGGGSPFTDALGTALGLERHGGRLLGSIFAVVLIDASVIGAGAVTLATSYAFGDVSGLRNSLHRSFREAKLFYSSYALIVGLAAATVLIPSVPLGIITIAVQALAAVMLPSATVFLVLLCSDREVMGPWINAGWHTALAVVVIGVLVTLSVILLVSTAVPGVDVIRLAAALGLVAAVVLLVVGAVGLRRSAQRRRFDSGPGENEADRSNWRMPAVALLGRPRGSGGRLAGLIALRAYEFVAIAVLIVKTVQLARG